MSKVFKLIPLINLDKSAQLQVLEIRNEENIRKWMFTEKVISVEDHFNWIEQLKNDESQLCLIIVNDKTQPVGAVNIKKIDNINKNAEIGFYKTQSINEKGLMSKSLYTVIDYCFNILGSEKLYTEVFEGNKKSINIHTNLLFTEEGFMRSHIIKEERRIGIHLFGLLKTEWYKGKNKIANENDIMVTRDIPCLKN